MKIDECLESHLEDLALGKWLSSQFPALSEGAFTLLLSLQKRHASHPAEFDP